MPRATALRQLASYMQTDFHSLYRVQCQNALYTGTWAQALHEWEQVGVSMPDTV